MKLGILASGNLGWKVLRYLSNENEVDFVMTDKKSDQIILHCETEGIPFFSGCPRKGKCSFFIENRKVDVLISINYLFIIEKDVIDVAERIAFNVHGSLLPKYRGRTPHVWAIINNEKETGVTAHKIDFGCDTGDIIEQVAIPIEEDDTGADILFKYEDIYIPLINIILERIKKNKLFSFPQDNSKATFFDKRTPDDGKINWNWHKERIKNWIRAQAWPYPGAFTFIENTKIIVDKIKFSEYGFTYDMPNGLIISVTPLLVKTSNGVIEIEQLRNSPGELKPGQILK